MAGVNAVKMVNERVSRRGFTGEGKGPCRAGRRTRGNLGLRCHQYVSTYGGESRIYNLCMARTLMQSDWYGTGSEVGDKE